jgi:hypothetical protein
VFKDGYMISKNDWSIENDKKYLKKYFSNISEGRFSSLRDEVIRLSGSLFPNISAKLMDGTSFNSWTVDYPSIYAFMSIKRDTCLDLLDNLISLNNEMKLPDIYLNFFNDGKEIKDNVLVKKASQLDNFNVIIDPKKEIKKQFEESVCIELKRYPTYMVIGKGEIIKWAKIGYDPNFFKKSLGSIFEVIYEEFINF